MASRLHALWRLGLRANRRRSQATSFPDGARRAVESRRILQRVCFMPLKEKLETSNLTSRRDVVSWGNKKYREPSFLSIRFPLPVASFSCDAGGIFPKSV